MTSNPKNQASPPRPGVTKSPSGDSGAPGSVIREPKAPESLSVVAKQSVADKKAAQHGGELDSTARAVTRQQQIAEAAYYLAERRGFAPGAELEDWLSAEAIVDGASTHS
jgi:hypothetical protein